MVAAKVSQRIEPLGWLMMAFAICVALWGYIAPIIGEIDGQRRPVLDPTLTITAMQKQGLQTIAQGTAYKTDDACEYVPGSLEWWWKAPSGKATRIPAYFRDPPMDRGEGWLEWHAIIVSLPPEIIRTQTFSTVLHDCGRPWLVKSVFYDATASLSSPTEPADEDTHAIGP